MTKQGMKTITRDLFLRQPFPLVMMERPDLASQGDQRPTKALKLALIMLALCLPVFLTGIVCIP